jgi:hypothetical protein
MRIGQDEKAYPRDQSRVFRQVERPKAEALGYLEASGYPEEKTRATADPYGMTNQRTSNGKDNSKGDDKSDGNSYGNS